MIGAQPAQIWWTADEIAAAALPEMPTTKRSINRLADRGQWQINPASGTTLTRSPSQSSAAGAAISLSGTAAVYVTGTAEDVSPASFGVQIALGRSAFLP